MCVCVCVCVCVCEFTQPSDALSQHFTAPIAPIVLGGWTLDPTRKPISGSQGDWWCWCMPMTCGGPATPLPSPTGTSKENPDPGWSWEWGGRWDDGKGAWGQLGLKAPSQLWAPLPHLWNGCGVTLGSVSQGLWPPPSWVPAPAWPSALSCLHCVSASSCEPWKGRDPACLAHLVTQCPAWGRCRSALVSSLVPSYWVPLPNNVHICFDLETSSPGGFIPAPSPCLCETGGTTPGASVFPSVKWV